MEARHPFHEFDANPLPLENKQESANEDIGSEGYEPSKDEDDEKLKKDREQFLNQLKNRWKEDNK